MRIIPSIVQMHRFDLQQSAHLSQPTLVHRLALESCEELLRVDDECAFAGRVCWEDVCEVVQGKITKISCKPPILIAEISGDQL